MAVLAACGPEGAQSGPGTGSEGTAVQTLKMALTGNGSVSSDLEILAVSGKSCGCVKVPNLTASASVGRDGSLLVPSPGGGPGCSYDL